MFEFFTNPGFLVAGGALVSAPIIIHLINRMRFKRIRWAAMEFLLKSQKRNRRRLIIEQLLLLALRCLLVVLTVLMICRFIGLGFAGFEQRDGLHVVVFDDTLSMSDRQKENDREVTCFSFAMEKIVRERIYNNISQSTTNERLAIIPLSKLEADPDFTPKIYQRLAEGATKKELDADLKQMKPSKLRVPLLRGVESAKKLLDNHPQKRHALHIISDFRRRDWTGPESTQLIQSLVELKGKKIDVWPIDTAHPYRVKGQGGVPASHDNVGIVDFRPNTRVTGKGIPVTFKVTIANYSPNEKQLNVVIYDDLTGQEMAQVDFNPPMPIKVQANSTKSASFELRLFPDIKSDKEFHAQKLSAHLETADRRPLEDDGLAGDNVRFASVEIRNKVPLLVIDGLGARGREDSKDSFFIERAIGSVPGGTYDIVFAHEKTGGKPAKILETADLSKFPTIFLLNVRELTDKQRDNLENFVKEGGGAAFFVGQQVNNNLSHYNKKLYRNGKGVFPVPLPDDQVTQIAKTKYTGDPQLLLRHQQFNSYEEFPIFGPIFKDDKQPMVLTDLPVSMYLPVDRSKWTKEPGKVFELATLPNTSSVERYRGSIGRLMQKLPTEDEKYKEFRPALLRYRGILRDTVGLGSDKTAYQLARVLKKMLTDKGKESDPTNYPNLTKFWSKTEADVRNLKLEVEGFYESTQFGDPFVVARKFGKGKVVAVMSTAGKDWNHFGGGSLSSFIYQPFIWEMQNWLSSQGAEANRMVGDPVNISVNLNRFKDDNIKQVMMVRSFFKAQTGKEIDVKRDAPTHGKPDKDGVVHFTFDKNFEPGFYLFQLYPVGGEAGTPLSQYGRVFNVDTANEGRLQRVSQDELNQGAGKGGKEGGFGAIIAPHEPPTGVINRRRDLSEWPLFFLVFIIVLVCEQALAVHLSFHLKAAEGQMPAQARPGRARAA